MLFGMSAGVGVLLWLVAAINVLFAERSTLFTIYMSLELLGVSVGCIMIEA